MTRNMAHVIKLVDPHPNIQIGDKVEILLHSRCRGIGNTGGGWSSDWIEGVVTKVNRVTTTVKHQYYFRETHTVKRNRIRKALLLNGAHNDT